VALPPLIFLSAFAPLPGVPLIVQEREQGEKAALSLAGQFAREKKEKEKKRKEENKNKAKSVLATILPYQGKNKFRARARKWCTDCADTE